MARTLDEVHEFVDPRIVAVRVVYAARDEDGVDVVPDLIVRGDLAAVRFHDVLHGRFYAQAGLVLVARALQQVREYLAERSRLLLCVWVWLVGFKD